jgi:hypothetical protein
MGKLVEIPVLYGEYTDKALKGFVNKEFIKSGLERPAKKDRPERTTLIIVGSKKDDDERLILVDLPFDECYKRLTEE